MTVFPPQPGTRAWERRESLKRIRAAEARAAQVRAERAGYDAQPVVVSGRAMIRVTYCGAKVADVTPAEAARIIAGESVLVRPSGLPG